MATDPAGSFDEVTEVTDDLIPERFEIDDTELATIDSESEFLRLSFELVKETAHWMTLLGGLVPAEPLDLNRAIIRGHTVRLAKLSRALMREIVADEPTQQLVLVRQILETAATLAYLLDDTDGARYTAYVHDGLVAEREMVKEITTNIANREEALEIEQRMLRSIQKTASAAGISDVTQLPGRRTIGFPSAEERLQLISDTAYVAYRGSSAEVHGTWSNLLRDHLTVADDGHFEPNLTSVDMRPQAPLTVTVMLTSLYADTIDRHVSPGQAEFFEAALRDLCTRAHRVDTAHELLLNNSQAGDA